MDDPFSYRVVARVIAVNFHYTVAVISIVSYTCALCCVRSIRSEVNIFMDDRSYSTLIFMHHGSTSSGVPCIPVVLCSILVQACPAFLLFWMVVVCMCCRTIVVLKMRILYFDIPLV